MEIFHSKDYKYFTQNYPMVHNSMFQNYYKKLRQQYKWFITFHVPFQKPLWANGNIKEIFDYVKDNKSASISIQNNQCDNLYKEPIEYVYYDTGDYQSKQKIYGDVGNCTVRLGYNTNEIYHCNFNNKYGHFTCGEDMFNENPTFLLFIGNYQYDTDKKHIFTLVNSKYESLEKSDYDKIHKFIKSMRDKKYNGLFDRVADRMMELY